MHRGGGKGQPPAGHGGTAAFFASLPPDDLAPLEAALRQVLLDWCGSLAHQPFPLTEWIDKRIGGELETRRGEDGHFELVVRGGAPPPAHGQFAPPPGNFGRQPAAGMPHPAWHHPGMPPPGGPPPGANPPPPAVPDRKGAKGGGKGSEAFFRTLPADAFSRPEEELRDSMFDFLASWKSQSLASLADLTKDVKIKKLMDRLLPPEVNLSEWIEKRIGGEIQLKKDGAGPHPIIHLSKPAQQIVAEKYKKIEAAKAAGGGSASAQAPAGRSGAGGQPPRPKAEARSAPGDTRSAEDFFRSLPADDLPDKELALREAVLKFIERWPKSSTPSLSDLTQDPTVMRSRGVFLPAKVSLKDWIDRRIGGEVVVDRDPKGNFQVYMRGSPPRVGGGGGKATGRSPAETAEAFFASLPDDSMTDQEADLRLAVLDYLENMNGYPASLQDAAKDAAISTCQSQLLPPEVNLGQWINRRIGGEVRIEKDSKGQRVMTLAAADEAPAQSGSDKKEEFFASLPDDSFTPEEEDLRDTLLAFLGQWQSQDPPSLSDAGGDAEIRRARPAVLPKGCQVSLKDWIERRIGGEIELAVDPRGSGQWLFGLRGALELPQPHGGAKRRRVG